MSRWFITFFALMVCAIINGLYGKDVSAFVAAGLLAITFADEEREFGEFTDDEY